ncbi:MAG: acyl-CoA dehydrogenase family protein [Piscinibacter sp.]
MTTVLSVARAAPSVAPAFDIDAVTERLAQALAATAVERDRAGGHAAAQRELIRASGLLALTVPKRHGGLGADWPTLYRVVRRLAQADSALAHVFSFHHLQIASLLLYGNAEQQDRLLRLTIAERLFWGNALNPIDRGLTATRVDGGWVLDGHKSFTSGALGSDRLTLSAHLRSEGEGAPPFLIGNLATHSPGLRVNADWDAFGQRQTDSGSARFEQVFLADRDVLQAPGVLPTPRASLRTLVSQLTMANLYLGIGEGAFDAARQYTLGQARPWIDAGVARSADDPFVQHRYGSLWLLLRPAQLAADAAAQRLQAALDLGAALDAAERGEVAVAIAEAKVLAQRAGVEVSSQLFELTGARSTSSRLGLDRFWRNARVHTLHDPVDYKLRDIGRFRLEGRVPEPGSYS